MLRRDSCIVCKNKTSKLFFIPKDWIRVWLKNVNQEKLLDEFTVDYIRNNGRICAAHFEDKYFTSVLKDKLHKIAVPFDPLPASSHSVATYTSLPSTSANPAWPSTSANPALPSTSANPALPSTSANPALPSTSANPALPSTSANPALPSTSANPALPSISANPISMSTSQDFSSFNNLMELENMTSTPKAIELTPKTKTINRLRCDISKLKKKLALKDNEMKALDYIKSKVTAVQYDFICDQIENSQKDPRGRCWTPRAKAMAMHIFLHGKNSYSVLRDYFAFPCINTLKNSVGIVSKDVGFCPALKAALQEKAGKLKSWGKLCTLVFDEMAIKKGLQYNAQLDYVDGWESAKRDGPKKLATQALVFMIRGIVHNWKQVIAYYFRASSSPQFWFQNCIQSILDDVGSCGFKVIATVCDMGPLNQALYRDLGITVSQPYFEYNNSKIFALFDICHILKSVQNNLMRYDIEFTEVKEGNDQRRRLTASWEDIEQFYEEDSKDDNKYRSAPKLTDNHIYTDGPDKMRVKLAAEVFSHTIAAGLSMSVRGGLLQSKASGTAEFVGCMNSLFDSMNSKERKSPKPLASAKTEHEKFWKDMRGWVQSWKFMHRETKKESPTKPCQRGLIITLKAVLGIFDFFKSEGIPFLLTNRLNQDCLENTFSSVRRRGGFRDNPDCREFRSTIRYVIVHNFTKKSKSSNCERDNAENFITLSNMNEKIAAACFEDGHVNSEANLIDTEMIEGNAAENITESKDEDTEMSTNNDGETEENAVIRPDEDLEQIIINTAKNDIQENVLAYIAGFLARAYLRKNPCEECKAILVNKDKHLDFHTFLLYFKEYKESEVGGLTWPSDDFFNCMKKLGEAYFECIDTYFQKPNVRKNICSFLQTKTSDLFKGHIHGNKAVSFHHTQICNNDDQT